MRATKCFVTASNSSRDTRGAYLVGLRGFFTIQSFLFFFLQVFAPRAVAHSRNAVQSTSTTLHNALEYVSIIFWNDGMIYSGFILLSARTICLPFMAYGSNCSSNSSLSIAGSVFRRGLRLWIPVAVALAISTRTFHAIGYHHVDEFAKKTINVSILAPYKIDDALIYFNSVFNIFWVTDKFSDQAGSYAFPGQMMWVVSVIYQQRSVPHRLSAKALYTQGLTTMNTKLHSIYDNGNCSIYPQKLARKSGHLFHLYSLVGAVLGLVHHHWPEPRRHGHQHGLQGKVPTRYQGSTSSLILETTD